MQFGHLGRVVGESDVQVLMGNDGYRPLLRGFNRGGDPQFAQADRGGCDSVPLRYREAQSKFSEAARSRELFLERRRSNRQFDVARFFQSAGLKEDIDNFDRAAGESTIEDRRLDPRRERLLVIVGLGILGKFEGVVDQSRVAGSDGPKGILCASGVIEGCQQEAVPSADEKTIAIPAAWLHRGETRFLLTALDDPAGAQNSFGAIAPGHTGLVYDALELTQDPEAHYNEQAFTARIEPTIFYRALPGGTVDIVDVFLQAGRLEETGNVELTIGSTSFEKQFSTASSFGELRLSFAVPEWYGVAPASVSLGKLRVTSTVEPAKKWTVAIIPHEHLDVGFTDYAAKVAELHSQSVDGAIDLIRRTPDFRWTLDGSWVATAYWK